MLIKAWQELKPITQLLPELPQMTEISALQAVVMQSLLMFVYATHDGGIHKVLPYHKQFAPDMVAAQG